MQDKRIEIVEGVWSVIAQQGIAAVSVRSVAAAAGVSPGRVQHYFATKTELVRASVEAMLDAAAEANPEALGDPADPATLRALLTHAIEPAASSRAGTSVYFNFVAASVADPWIGHALAQARAGVVDEVERCLRAQVAEADASALALELTLLAEGATQSVFLGWCRSEQALDLIRRSIGRATGLPD